MLSRLSKGARIGGRRTAISSSSASSRSASRIAPRLAATGAVTAPAFRSQLPAAFYSTERVLQLRTNEQNKERLPKTIYDPSRETENCGVGLVASLKSVASRKVVEDADEMLIRMSHRGGVGCCPASGDGAGEWEHKLLNHDIMMCIIYISCRFSNSSHTFIQMHILFIIKSLFQSISPILSFLCQ